MYLVVEVQSIGVQMAEGKPYGIGYGETKCWYIQIVCETCAIYDTRNARKIFPMTGARSKHSDDMNHTMYFFV